MHGTLVHIPIQRLSTEEQAAFDAVLSPLGVRAEGRRGNELVLKVSDLADAHDFFVKLEAALNTEPAARYRERYKAVTSS